MPKLANRITTNPIGKALFNSAVKPALHFFRRVRNPDLPTDQVVTHVKCLGRDIKIYHRRHNDYVAIAQCFEQTQYDFPIGVHGEFMQRHYDQIVASGSQPLIIDCGANIGASVLWYSARYPKAHIVAIEPAPDNFALLARNTTGLDVDARQAGIAATDGEARLDASHGTGLGYRTSEEADGPPVKMISIATILAQKDASRYTPFLLKIDVEGAEKDLFSGDCSAINLFPIIILEPHDWLLPGQRSSMEFFRFHAAAGREFCMKDENVASIAHDDAMLAVTEGFRNWYGKLG